MERQGLSQAEKNRRSDTLQDRGPHLTESKASFQYIVYAYRRENFSILATAEPPYQSDFISVF